MKLTSCNLLFIISLIILIIAIYIFFKTINVNNTKIGGNTNTTNNTTNNIKKNTIFISVASYRDNQCPLTLKDLFKKAQNPHNVYVGICQQNHIKDIDCSIQKYCSVNKICTDNQIRIMRLDYKEAKGPTFARYHCSKLYENEEYFMQIDSHTRFTENWDTKLINMLKQCDSNKPILTYYPLNYDSKDTGIPIICESKFADNEIPTYQSYIYNAPIKPKLTPFVAAGFFFCNGSFLKEVPYDPNLPYLFNGEETLFTIRLWTHGYDFYVPNDNIVYHYYDRKNEPKFWDDLPDYSKEVKQTIIKVLYLLKRRTRDQVPKHLLKDLDKYNLGTTRTLEEYYNFSKLDKNHKKSNKEWCSKYNK